MIIFIILSFIFFISLLVFLSSYELRNAIQEKFHAIFNKDKLYKAKQFAHEINTSSSIDQTQSHWHLQQWWILIAGLVLFSSILIFSFTRPISPTEIEANYLRKSDPQIYALLKGEMLTPPPEVDEKLVEEAISSAIILEQQNANNSTLPSHSEHSLEALQQSDRAMIDRKWNKMNPRYKQRLLMVFKIMKERHGYELVLLEGYRSPERQNRLSGNKNTTLAKAYQSYHQFGLAADVAFKRDGKVVISERDPWAMKGYQLYGEVAESVGLTWGGRWKSIQDYGHTEYRMPGLRKTREMAEQLTTETETGDV
ncbi:D-alanyl-D-alanine carboxypeptidase [Acinetobacter sp. ANC 4558]|uniref:M15 family metallopeptidase n=1 Tax=Acinetobacter sp. ANC 4558 TaxID=1977876 RepID=UPI000A33DA90|nr:M15 family metallopeptidase [Acinetobacter sp. ANC 4558]OTG86389.1 D-alanyl-D-alanine carboxypeptidase [Acinetobacter sp. ANC 4558]